MRSEMMLSPFSLGDDAGFLLSDDTSGSAVNLCVLFLVLC